MSDSSGLRTPSLRRRLTGLVLLAVAVMLVVLVVAADRALAARLDGQLRQRLLDRADVASALVDQVDGADLAGRLEGQGVSVLLTESDGATYARGPLAAPGGSSGAPTTGSGTSGRPQPPSSPRSPGPVPATPAPAPSPPGTSATVVQQGDLLSVSTTLSDGSRLQLFADAGDVAATLRQVRLVLGVTALLVLLVAGIAVPLVVGAGLRPLDRITGVARSITAGDRARRLRPTHPGSELGRTATAFDEMLDELVGAEQRARDSEERLRRFLSDAAHDLRTPLAGVQVAAERVLRDDPPRAEREQSLTRLIREARRSSRLVDDLLLVARIDSGLELRTGPVDLGALARAVADAREPTAGDVDLVVHQPPAPVMVTADRDQLVRALGNVVDNAVRASRSSGTGPVEITVRTTAASTVEMAVRDHGPGVPAADRERIFDRLVRLDAARTSGGSGGSGGSGLGLPIARGIARAHGGDLTCEPVEAGACFVLTLPAGAAAHPDGANDGPDAALTPTAG